MNTHKTDWSRMSTPTLLDRRHRLVARLGEAETLLAGSLVEQNRRCGKAGCRCAEGEPHGPYVYFAPKTAGPAGTAVADDRRRAEPRAGHRFSGRSGDGAGQHDDGESGRRQLFSMRRRPP